MCPSQPLSECSAPDRLPVLLETDGYRILDKPAGLSVLKDNTGRVSLDTVYQSLFNERPYIVHRLDKGTSGILIVARTPQVRTLFNRLFAQGEIAKTYLALVEREASPPEGTIDQPLAEGRKGRFKIASPGTGLPSRTDYRTIHSTPGQSLLECRPLTGRTHQIRVHLAWLGCPLVRDPLYGRRRGRPSLEPDLTLHSWKVMFKDPISGEERNIESPLPEWALEMMLQATGSGRE